MTTATEAESATSANTDRHESDAACYVETWHETDAEAPRRAVAEA